MLHLQILTPEEIFFDDEIISVVVPGEMGYLGVLEDHAPLMTSIKAGIVTITDKNNNELFYKVQDGFFEVKKNQAVLLVEKIEPTEVVREQREI